MDVYACSLLLPCDAVICMRQKGPEKKSHWCVELRRHLLFCFVFHFFVKTMSALDEKQRKSKPDSECRGL